MAVTAQFCFEMCTEIETVTLGASATKWCCPAGLCTPLMVNRALVLVLLTTSKVADVQSLTYLMAVASDPPAVARDVAMSSAAAVHT